MCGIVGIAARGQVDRAAISSATARLAHRGPDGDGLWFSPDGKTGFGHRRLAIIDLSPAGAQPMASADGRYVITYNGEIYNFAALRDDLAGRGHTFRTHTDTEVVLAGYAEFGPAVVDHLNGIFAFAVHDVQTGEVFVARDHMGVKPLYFAETASAVVFASEIKALQALSSDLGDIDVVAVRRYLTFLWCPGDRTPLTRVKRLEPGQALILRDGAVVRHWTYWTPPAYAPRYDWSKSQCASELAALIDRCVENQMVADVPVGAFLSGGLDSSAIVAAARHKAPGIRCFTIDLADGSEAGSTDDLPYARRVAAHLGVALDEVRVDGRAFCDAVPDMVELLDEPLADPATLNALFISRLARDSGITVLLSGAGGDDLFTGYRRHTTLALQPYWAAMPSPMRRGLGALSTQLGQGSTVGRRLAKALSFLSEGGGGNVAASFAWGPPGIADGLMSEDARSRDDGEDVFAPLEALLDSVKTTSLVEQCLALEKRFFLADHNLLYTDKMGMAAGVEARVPLIDLDMVAFAATVPVEWKHRGLTPKWIMKKSQEGVLPNDVIYRPKTGFGAPLRRWMKTDMRDMAEELLSPRTVDARGLFSSAEITRLRAADDQGQVDASYTLFSLMCVELWCRRFADTVSPAR